MSKKTFKSIQTATPKNVERLYKQPRSALKTVAKGIGNSELTLFTMPQQEQGELGMVVESKETMTKNMGALCLYLIQKYQESNSDCLEITNINSISKEMNCTNHRLKTYLLHLGGYTYPIIDRDDKTKELVLTNELLFKIEFRYDERIVDKYHINNRGEIQNVDRKTIRNSILSFIEDEPIKRIIVTPNQRFKKGIEGKGLGNILTVDIVSIILDISPMTTKILYYSFSNKPNWTISEDNFIKHLGLEKQLKTQGRNRIRATILKGLQQLQDIGHMNYYSYSDETGMYRYTCTNKYAKFKDSKRAEKLLKGVQ